MPLVTNGYGVFTAVVKHFPGSVQHELPHNTALHGFTEAIKALQLNLDPEVFFSTWA